MDEPVTAGLPVRQVAPEHGVFFTTPEWGSGHDAAILVGEYPLTYSVRTWRLRVLAPLADLRGQVPNLDRQDALLTLPERKALFYHVSERTAERDPAEILTLRVPTTPARLAKGGRPW